MPLLALLACTTSNLGGADAQAPLLGPVGDVIDGEFVISADLDGTVAADLGIAQLAWNASLGAGLYEALEPVDASALAAALRTTARGDLLVEHNRPRTVSADPYRALQWNLDALDIEAAWAVTRGAGATVAVIDSGVAEGGEDTPVNLVRGWDFVDDDANPNDENGHGTHVAGTIAQATDNGRGVAGVAPEATVLAVRAMDANGSGSAWGIASAITYAVDHGADIVNLSLGSPWSTSIESQAIDYAYKKGVLVVAASGNSGAGAVDYPAAYSQVLAVGATRADGAVAAYSNTGNALDLVAPGGDMGRDQNGDGYADGIVQETLSGSGFGYLFFEGTSMAAPHVAGAAALLIAAGAPAADVRGLLQDTAVVVGGTGGVQ
jgi:serine protease